MSDYLIQRAREPWLEDLLVACEEIRGEELIFHRSRGVESGGLVDLTIDDQPRDGGEEEASGGSTALATTPPEAIDEETFDRRWKAIQWATGAKDTGVLRGLLASLPDTVVDEQVELWKAAASAVAERKTEEVEEEAKPKILADNLNERYRVLLALDKYLKAKGMDSAKKLPRNCIKSFIERHCVVPTKGRQLKSPAKSVSLWYRHWLARGKSNTEQHCKRGAGIKTKKSLGLVKASAKRRGGDAGRPCQMPLVRHQLYDWFVGMRYGIDWKQYNAQMRAEGRTKCIGRFPMGLLRAKLKQLMQDYCRECLIAGISPDVPKIRWDWFLRWFHEYGLSMRKANRRYKCPKWLVAERLEIWWLTLARIRTLCIEVNGYDPEMENFDQSPFHNNETGAQDKPVLALAGSNAVPLLEGRHDVLQRWTGNFTTWSNPERIKEEGPPYAELMFKASPDGSLVLKLRDHIRSRGYSPWRTVACQEKGSYREEDILAFLEKHLPEWGPGRRWRIIMADDYGPHKSANVFNSRRFAYLVTSTSPSRN